MSCINTGITVYVMGTRMKTTTAASKPFFNHGEDLKSDGYFILSVIFMLNP